MLCNWKFGLLRDQKKEPKNLKDWARQLNISDFLTRLLWHRGIRDLKEMDIFLSPGLRHLPLPSTWPELDQAGQILAEALQENDRVAIWGDYDVDGLTATALMTDFLKRRGYKAIPYLPDRFQEGYGLSKAGLEYLASQGIKVLITVDCGVSDCQEIQRAKDLGMIPVVTDHHMPGSELPPAQAIVNPRLKDCPYPNLAGVGVAFLFSTVLNNLLPGEKLDLREYLDLVALGTIADLVTLSQENRILVKNGLLHLSEAKRPGIFALKEVSKLPPTAPIGSGQVGFSLAPRLNAAGRMDSAQVALDLLMAPDLEAARPLAEKLDHYNQDRRKQEESVIKEALAQITSGQEITGLVCYDPKWHQGVIGVAASRVMEEFYRPTLLLSKEGDILKGSGRSIPQVNLYQALESCRDFLLDFGGHPMAAGFSLSPDNLSEFQDMFKKAVGQQLGSGKKLDPNLQIEAKLGLGMIDLQLVKEIDLLQPFGPGNPQPIFCSKPLSVQKYRTFGRKHVSLEVREDQAGVTMLGKVWRMAHILNPDIQGKTVQLAFTPRLNHYNGMTSIDLQVRDLRYL